MRSTYFETVRAAAFLILCFPAFSSAQSEPYHSIHINEVMSSNSGVITDIDGDSEDWIELYNSGNQIINLNGWGLSDDYNSPFKWTFPDVNMQPGQYLLVWASGKDRRPADGELSAGGLIREVYTDIPGYSVDDLINSPSYPDHPTSVNILSPLFEAPVDIGDYYGQRVTGWIKAPETGLYSFWISSDDNSRLYLSTSDIPADTAKIAYVPGWTSQREWEKYPQQKSEPISLQAGEYYYVKALMKEHEGGDHLSVGWQLPDGTMQRPLPASHLYSYHGELHTNFKISASGEEVILTAPDGTKVDELEPTPIPSGISIGRYPNGTGDWFFYTNPTPGEPNLQEGYQDILEPVIFSVSGGFYNSDVMLTLSHSDPDVIIYYTLDGSVPHPGNTTGSTYTYKNQYQNEHSGQPDGEFLTGSYQTIQYDNNPISISNRTGDINRISRISSTYDQDPNYFPSFQIFKGTTVRAKAYKPGSLSESIITHSYFIDPQGSDRYSLPVISITVQDDDFFDYNKGIYVAGYHFDQWRQANPDSRANGASGANYQQRGIEWEVPASLEIYDSELSGGQRIQQDIGIRINGAWSRAYRMKSLRLYARNDYGNSRFNMPLFPNQPGEAYNRLILRNSGTDSPYTMFRDAAIQSIVGHMNFETQAYRPFVVFLNGEYWGIHNLRERFDRHYLERVYNLDGNNIDYLNGNARVNEGDAQHYLQTLQYIQNNGVENDNDYAFIQTRIDVQNFIDYQIAQIYAANTDWPGNNIDFWRYRTDSFQPDAPYGQDGRWRWLLFDTDFGFSLFEHDASHNTLAFATAPNEPDWPNPSWSTFLLRSLLENYSFRNSFINRFADQLNTAFQSDRVLEIIGNKRDHIAPSIVEHIERWQYPHLQNTDHWDHEINKMLVFAQQRPAFMRDHIKTYFGLEQLTDLTVDVADPATGIIKVNTIEITESTPGVDTDPYPWTGSYFVGVPVTLTALPLPGFRFSHWEGVPEGDAFRDVIQLPMSETTSVTAIFTEFEHSEDFPEAFTLNSSGYHFSHWGADSEAGSYPDHMAFVFMNETDPGLDASVSGFTEGAYNLQTHTRINGLGDDGFAFINTNSPDGNPGYPGTRLGGAILALNTIGVNQIQVNWQAATILPNSLKYNLRLQYRIGYEGPFTDLLYDNGSPVEYKRSSNAGDRMWIPPVILPEEAENEAYVQLLWRYYYTGEQADPASSLGSKMAVTSIDVEALLTSGGGDDFAGNNLPASVNLAQNYPNPFNPITTIIFELPERSDIRLEVFDLLGRRVAMLAEGVHQAGRHQAVFDGTRLSSGMYLYRLETSTGVITKRMMLVK